MRVVDTDEVEDVELLSRARAGDVDAFGELVRRHQQAALRLASSIAGSSDAPDIVQDAFVRAHSAISSYRATGTVRSWMLRIVANHAKNQLRRRLRRVHRDERHARLELRADPAPDEAAVERLALGPLADAVARLPARDRAVIGCRYLAELSEAETADVLGVPPGTVKSRTSRALARLRADLEGTNR